ncbi:hypothetical protein MMC18_001412 [Xylographa bjoerkii]|nr:hypothetical protein [Xylographa bjoerkii]
MFKLPLPPRYEDNYPTASKPVSLKNALTITHFIQMATIMLSEFRNPVTNNSMTLDESRALSNTTWAFLDALSWHISIPFRHVLGDIIYIAEQKPIVDELVQKCSEFKQLVRSAGFLMGDDPFTRPASITAGPPAQNVAELHVQMVLLKRGSRTVDEAAAALIGTFVKGKGRTFSCGMPNTMFLFAGTDGGKQPRVVATMNKSAWKLPDLDNWCTKARESRVSLQLKHIVALSTVVADDLDEKDAESVLTKAFQDGGDAELAAEWQELAMVKRMADPIFYNRSTLRAMPFAYPWIEPRTRCRRCRTLFRFNVVNEEHEFIDGPWPELSSCAEVLSDNECIRYGLH